MNIPETVRGRTYLDEAGRTYLKLGEVETDLSHIWRCLVYREHTRTHRPARRWVLRVHEIRVVRTRLAATRLRLCKTRSPQRCEISQQLTF